MQWLRLIALALLALTVAGCELDQSTSARVYQGKCLAVDGAQHRLTLANSEPDKNQIKGPQAEFDLASAKVGLNPEVGDLMRVAYLQKGEKNLAVKVMNVSKQDLRRK